MILTLRGMRGGHVYKFEGVGDATELRHYREVYSGGEDELMLESSVSCGVQTMIELMNTCGILRWNGFHGKHPKNVSDGIMFDFTANVNGGQTIRADGSANFPKGYHEFVHTLNEMLAERKHTDSNLHRHSSDPSPSLYASGPDYYVMQLRKERISESPPEEMPAEEVLIPEGGWQCFFCRQINTGKFCTECGKPRTNREEG